MTLSIASGALVDGDVIPGRHTCEGADIAPPLTWSGVPAAAQSLVLIVNEPDAPDPKAPKMTWVHWILYNIPTDVSGLTEGGTAELLPDGTRDGLNDWKRTGYGGPANRSSPLLSQIVCAEHRTSGHGESDQGHQTAYPVMQYVDGLDLTAYVQRVGGRLPTEAALGIMTPVLDAFSGGNC